MAQKIKVLIAKPGLDGHDLGARLIARTLRDAGMEVVYTGRHQTPEQIVATAKQEDVDVVGLSILSGAHLILTEKLMAILSTNDMTDKIVVIGGTIPKEDVAKLKASGTTEVFPVGTSPEKVTQFISSLFERS